MSSFKLLSSKLSNGEEQRTYYLIKVHFNFNQRIIDRVTITDHYQIKHSKLVSDELIFNLLLGSINGLRVKPRSKHKNREIYVQEVILPTEKKYRLIFWFKDNTPNHLWIRNCYPKS